MAKIVENHQGRRMIRLSTDDVLTVVSLYQQQLYDLQARDFNATKSKLDTFQFYLPEEP